MGSFSVSHTFSSRMERASRFRLSFFFLSHYDNVDVQQLTHEVLRYLLC